MNGERPPDMFSGRKDDGRINWRVGSLLVVVNVALLALGVGSTFWFFGQDIGIAGLSVALPAMSLCTFLVLFTDSRDVRTAVMSAFTVLYFGFVAASFNSDVARAMADKTGFLDDVYDSFNTFMIVMVGFYFGGKAAEKVVEKKAAAALTPEQPVPGPALVSASGPGKDDGGTVTPLTPPAAAMDGTRA
ncbi:hypothetical protein ACFWVC_24120 [Streptomyces sp. NPDC058691]|uniref:hypothetical protein n=1 Tax=Streptomyces sp. NPDC058691 TaxID=3346601 RepID=UPI00364AF467